MFLWSRSRRHCTENFPPTTRKKLIFTDHPLDFSRTLEDAIDQILQHVGSYLGFKSRVAVTTLVLLLPLNDFTPPPMLLLRFVFAVPSTPVRGAIPPVLGSQRQPRKRRRIGGRRRRPSRVYSHSVGGSHGGEGGNGS